MVGKSSLLDSHIVAAAAPVEAGAGADAAPAGGNKIAVAAVQAAAVAGDRHHNLGSRLGDRAWACHTVDTAHWG